MRFNNGRPRAERQPPPQPLPVLATAWTPIITAVTGARGQDAWIIEGIARDEVLGGELEEFSRDVVEYAFRRARDLLRAFGANPGPRDATAS